MLINDPISRIGKVRITLVRSIITSLIIWWHLRWAPTTRQQKRSSPPSCGKTLFSCLSIDKACRLLSTSGHHQRPRRKGCHRSSRTPPLFHSRTPHGSGASRPQTRTTSLGSGLCSGRSTSSGTSCKPRDTLRRDWAWHHRRLCISRGGGKMDGSADCQRRRSCMCPREEASSMRCRKWKHRWFL